MLPEHGSDGAGPLVYPDASNLLRRDSCAMITIVSGLPRSGTSLMMQMLAAGGMAVLTDSLRKPDADNPRGYYEWESVKRLPRRPELIDQANGKVVKVISQLLLSIPEGRNFKIVFMERDLAEVLLSQDEMLRRRGAIDSTSNDLVAAAFEEHLNEVAAWFKDRLDLSVLHLKFKDLLHDPVGSSKALQDFLALNLNVEAMVRQVDLSLYRNRLS